MSAIGVDELDLELAEDQPNASLQSKRVRPNVGAWFGFLATASMAVVVVTTLVAFVNKPVAASRDPFALKDVPESIDGHMVTTDFGRQLFNNNCSTCHSRDATGMPRQGANLRDSAFVSRRTDSQLMVFLRTGRMPGDRESVLGLTMPPRGGNPNLEDDELADIVAYLRLVQKTAEQHKRAEAAGNQTLQFARQ